MINKRKTSKIFRKTTLLGPHHACDRAVLHGAPYKKQDAVTIHTQHNVIKVKNKKMGKIYRVKKHAQFRCVNKYNTLAK